jgi:hypothetical protein
MTDICQIKVIGFGNVLSNALATQVLRRIQLDSFCPEHGKLTRPCSLTCRIRAATYGLWDSWSSLGGALDMLDVPCYPLRC